MSENKCARGSKAYVDKSILRVKERGAMIRYLQELSEIVSLCEDFKKDIIEFVFTDSTGNAREAPNHLYYFCWTPRYQSRCRILCGVVEICDMLGIDCLEGKKSEMLERVAFLSHPDSVQRKWAFESHIDFIANIFREAEEEIRNRLQLLEKEEIDRLNEALHCYGQSCNYAAIAMSVSAIEFRLLSLMMSECPDPKLDELTLGQLIREYLDDKEKYGSAIPKKHQPLLEHCNVYRVFSVHPKREKITRSIASSIINMTFAFLLDEDLKHRAEAK